MWLGWGMHSRERKLSRKAPTSERRAMLEWNLEVRIGKVSLGNIAYEGSVGTHRRYTGNTRLELKREAHLHGGNKESNALIWRRSVRGRLEDTQVCWHGNWTKRIPRCAELVLGILRGHRSSLWIEENWGGGGWRTEWKFTWEFQGQRSSEMEQDHSREQDQGAAPSSPKITPTAQEHGQSWCLWGLWEQRKEPPEAKGRFPRLKPIQMALDKNRNWNSLCQWLCVETSPARVRMPMCSQKMLTFCSPRSEKSKARQGSCSWEIYNYINGSERLRVQWQLLFLTFLSCSWRHFLVP